MYLTENHNKVYSPQLVLNRKNSAQAQGLNRRRQVYLQRVGLFLPPPSPVLANIYVDIVVQLVFFTPERTPTSTDKSVYASIRCTWYTQCSPVNTKHLYNICTTTAQRLRRWTNIVQMLYKCFVFTGRPTHPIPVQCWASVATHCCFNAGQSYSTLAQH